MAASSENSALLAQAAAAGITALLTWGLYTYLTYDPRWWWKRRAAQTGMEVPHREDWEAELIHGSVAPGWEPVREEFVHSFRARGDLGAAVCIYFRGERVVDLWGGYRDRQTRAGWEEDTLVPIFSSTKGISAFALMMLTSAGKLDLEEKVAKYWPDFAQNGKEDVTVADLIDHSVGLAGIDPPITLEMLRRENSAKLRDHLAKAEMEWPKARDYKGYMAVMLGFYESVLVQLTEGSGKERTIGQYLREEAFEPLNIADEIYIGLPDSVPGERIATIDGMGGLEPLWPTGAFPDGLMSKILLKPSSYTARAFRNPQLSMTPGVCDYNRRDVQRVEMPASGGMATARAVATMYSAAERSINTIGEVNPLKLSQAALDQFLKPALPGRNNGWIDEVIGAEACMGAGLLLPPPEEYRGSGRFMAAPAGFGTPGAGGSFGYCDPNAEVAYSYVMNRAGQLIVDDPREFALRARMYDVVQTIRVKEGRTGLKLEELNTPHYLARTYMDAHPELKRLP